MCLTEPATVLAGLGDEALVATGGRARIVANLIVADLHAGDDVLIGLGSILARVSKSDAAELRALRAAVTEEADPSTGLPDVHPQLHLDPPSPARRNP